MLQPLMHVLRTKRIVLASGSPRRKTILQNIGLSCEVIPSTFEENLDKSSFEHPHQYVTQTAKLKGLEVANKLFRDEKPPDVVIACDTVVTMGGKINEKPKDKEQAFQMLSSFSGGKHTVISGVVIITKDDLKHVTSVKEGQYNVTSFHEETDVKFAEISPEVITAYIETGEPMDKAGGYGIQAAGGTLVEGISGDYFNVMGFPLHRFSKILSEMFNSSHTGQTHRNTLFC